MINLNVLYEDNHIIVVIKPINTPSQADKTGDQDMLSIVKAYLKEKYNKPGEVYLGLVHRLDRMTSGIMVFAKTSKGASRLSKCIREGNFKKEYIAAVEGIIEQGGNLENYLVKDERTNTSRIVFKNTRNAKKALLEYSVIGHTMYNKKEYTYVRVKLYTGRHHQIRVQFSSINHPLFGDVKYKGVKGDLALVSCFLKFIHPTKDEIMEFEYLPEKKGIWGEL